MARHTTVTVLLLAAALQGACSSPEAPPAHPGSSGSEQPATTPDAGNPADAGPPAETVPDASATAPGDAGTAATPGATMQTGGTSERTPLSASARGPFDQGLAAAQQNQLEAALHGFEAALAADPRAYQAAYNAGVIAERQGQAAQADGFYQRALAIQPDYEPAVVARTRILMRENRLNDAVTLAAGIARSYPHNTAVRADYARLLVLANRDAEAITEARQILRVDERNVDAKLAVAEAYRAQGHMDQAMYIVDDLVNGSDPSHPNNGSGANNPQVQYLRGLLQIDVQHNVPAAIQSFQRAVELDPQFAEARNNLGVQYLQAGNYQQAQEQLATAVALSPAWAKAHLNLGDVLRATGQYDRALAEFQRTQQLDPSLVEVHYNLGRLYVEQARGVSSTGAENLQHKIQLFQLAQAAFTHFRDALGSAYNNNPRHDDVEAQLARLPTQIQRSTTALQRAQRSQSRTTTAPATPPTATPPAAATPEGGAPATPPTTPPTTPPATPPPEGTPPAATQPPAGTPPAGTEPAGQGPAPTPPVAPPVGPTGTAPAPGTPQSAEPPAANQGPAPAPQGMLSVPDASVHGVATC